MKHLGTQTIETPRLILRRFYPEDAAAMFENWAGDPDVTKFLTWPTHQSVSDSQAILSQWIQDYEKAGCYQWCIQKKDSGEIIGSLGVVSKDEGAESVEIGYCIGKAFWHCGYTSEAVRAVIRFFFERVGANRVEAKHDPNNPNSGKVMRKCGMAFEGTKRRAGLNNTGVCDCSYYGIFRSDFNRQEI